MNDKNKNDRTDADLDLREREAPSDTQIPEIMRDIKAAVLHEAKEREVLEMSGSKRATFFLTEDMQVNTHDSRKVDISMTLGELKKLIGEIVKEELSRMK